ncbi:hypothetical protein [Sulfurisphaera tokodaii]|uniref:Uncharacterized protein n=2 Tax=Sulfurisphaera tokodaii TaxID=111955 RepID=Q972Z2_SULTO|nr:hypothetical protein [Sulfurisphaera tokodaii]BAB66021.1 hypothetical protein STK_09970 [Sulfurisphaera tokodaii str. 7]HII73983.1 hypothetical protein [Sulfurisphaera tokodaii]
MDKDRVKVISKYSNVTAFLALVAIFLLAMFPLSMYLLAAYMAIEGLDLVEFSIFGFELSMDFDTSTTMAGMFFGGAGAFGGLAAVAHYMGYNTLALVLLIVGIGLAFTGLGFG